MHTCVYVYIHFILLYQIIYNMMLSGTGKQVCVDFHKPYKYFTKQVHLKSTLSSKKTGSNLRTAYLYLLISAHLPSGEFNVAIEHCI